MQTIKQEVLSIEAANQMLDVDLVEGMWKFIVRMINYPELKFDDEAQTIHIEGYVPFKELAREWVNRVADGSYDVRSCESCGAYFDVNTEEGIFGKPDEFEEYICISCAGQMTALTYYQRFIER